MGSSVADMKDRLYKILQKMDSKHVLVVGDLILDHYIETVTTKLAREAPIPVSKIISENAYAGGAGNLAVNITSLRGKATIVGTIGNDYEGMMLSQILESDGVDISNIIKIDKQTSLHTRYYVDKHLYLRIDREITRELDKNTTEKLFDNIKSIINSDSIDCICVSDYDKGTITPRLLRYIAELANSKGIPIYGQPMIRHYLDYIGFTAIKSNMKEASKATGISIINESSLHNLGINLLTRLSCKYLVLTTGKKGLTSFEENNIISIPALTSAREFRKAIGIRDAMTAVLSLALCSGAELVEAALLSNIAAAIATPSISTVVLSKKDFENYVDKFETQLISKVPLHR